MQQKIIFCGDRNWDDEKPIRAALEELIPEETIIINGGARGADKLAGRIAKEMGFDVIEVPANWEKYGKAAGPIRNREMLELNPTLVIAFHKNIEESKGTKNMLKIAKEAGVDTILIV
jgi:hypothetical protein